MNLLIFRSEELQSGNTLSLSGRRAEHLHTVCRVSEGDVLRVGEINGLTGTGRVRRVAPDEITLCVDLTEKQRPATPVTLILALPRPLMLKRILEFCGSISLARLCLIRTARVERSFFTSPVLKNMTEYFERGMEQGMTTVMPVVEVFDQFRPFVEDVAPTIAASHRVVFHLGARLPNLRSVLTHIEPANEVIVAIGPEGGFVDFEVALFQAQGFTPCSLGAHVLRVESAVSYAFGQIELLRAVPETPFASRPEISFPSKEGREA